MSAPGPSRWRFVVLPIVVGSTVLTSLARDHGVYAAIWPRWRTAIEQGTLLVAVIVAVTATVTGVVTWRRAQVGHD